MNVSLLSPLVTSDCLEWNASHSSAGYGRFVADRFQHQAHRFLYQKLTGAELPHGIELDHLCRNRGCVNPLHLEPVTHRENCVRGIGVASRARDTHCARGHAFTGWNVATRRNGRRRCRECANARRRKRRAA